MYSPFKRQRTWTNNSTNSTLNNSQPKAFVNYTRPSYGSNSYGKKRRPQASRNSLAYQIRSMEAVKHYVKSDGTLNQTMIMNQVYLHQPTQQVSQGDTNSNRDGDNIYLNALKTRFMFHDLAAITDGVTYRLLVGWTDIASSVSGFTAATASDYFLPSAGTYFSNYIVDPKKLTVILDKTYDQNTLITGVRPVQTDAINIQLDKAFTYQTGDTRGKGKNLTVLVVAQVVGGTAGTTQVGNVYMGYDLIFRNSK